LRRAASTVETLCIFSDGGTPVRQLVVDRAGQTCGAKPCWKNAGSQGLAYQDKAAFGDGITKMSFGGRPAGKGKASAQGKNEGAEAKMNTVKKDDGHQYKAQKK